MMQGGGSKRGHATRTKRKLKGAKAAAREAPCCGEKIQFDNMGYPWYNLTYPKISQTADFVRDAQKIYQGCSISKFSSLVYPRLSFSRMG